MCALGEEYGYTLEGFYSWSKYRMESLCSMRYWSAPRTVKGVVRPKLWGLGEVSSKVQPMVGTLLLQPNGVLWG